MLRSEEDVVRQKDNTMADDVVYISDDEDRADGPAAAAANAANRQQQGGHYNIYEGYEYLAGAVVANQPARAQQSNDDETDDRDDDDDDVVVYVPDDSEEEKFLIGPIRKKASAIIFGSRLNAPNEFPFEKLADIDLHVEKSLKNVSGTTEKNIWECILEQLSIMRIAYSQHIDVRSKAIALCRRVLYFIEWAHPNNILSI